MQIVVAGGTGFVGRPLVDLFARNGDRVTVLTRTARAPNHVAWAPDGSTGAWARALDAADVVVNLAGEPIAARRWTPAQRERLVTSRLLATRSLVAAMRARPRPPALFLSSSATGYYGPHGDEAVTEATPAGTDFLGQLCARWEAAAHAAESPATRVALLRTGIVLERDGGALAKMLPPFRLGVGGPMGSGRQFMPWIHRADWLALVRWIVDTPGAAGPFNATAPNPVTNRDFAATLGRVLHRPALVPAPGFALRLALGEMAGPLLLEGQRVLPARATGMGFRFRYPQLEEALGVILEDGRR